MISCEPIWQDVKTEKAPDPRQGDLDRLEALVHQLDADSPLVLDEDATRKRPASQRLGKRTG